MQGGGLFLWTSFSASTACMKNVVPAHQSKVAFQVGSERGRYLLCLYISSVALKDNNKLILIVKIFIILW